MRAAKVRQPKAKKQSLHPAMLVTWTESEAGWGQRPDGFSLHLNEKEVTKYIKKHSDWLLKTYGPNAPHEYSRPDSEKGTLVLVPEKIFAELEKKKSLRYDQNDYTKLGIKRNI